MVSFQDLTIPQDILRALDDMGFAKPTPVQEATIPLLFQGRDVIARAQTGTGKTAAFGIPLIAAATEGRLSLVLVPTRELAQQVAGEIERLGAHTGVKALALYGGAPLGGQARALEREDVAIVVATPGRLADHIQRGNLDPSACAIAVLDEADEMLKMGFAEEVEAVLDAIGPVRQTLLFSATMPDAVRRLAARHLTNPEHVTVTASNDSVATERTEQFAVAAPYRAKTDALVRLLAVEDPTGVLVFRHTRQGVDELVTALRGKGLAADALHGGMGQDLREAVLERLRRGRGRIVVATNVAARGLDVDTLSHVVNYDVPKETDAYVHRIGRTGRAGRDGVSFLLVAPSERRRVNRIEDLIGHSLMWRDVPTDDDVKAAVAERTAKWLVEQAAAATPAHLAMVDDVLADGGDLRTLAAGLLARLSRHEGVGMPDLEDPQPTHRPRTDGGRYEGPMATLCLSVGHNDQVRPGDIVGALANETGLTGGDIGRIDILAGMSVAEVPADRADAVVTAMSGVTIRRRRVNVRVAHDWTFRAPARGGGRPMRRPRRGEPSAASASHDARPYP